MIINKKVKKINHLYLMIYSRVTDKPVALEFQVEFSNLNIN